MDGGAYSDGAAGAAQEAGSSVDAGDAGGPCAVVSVGPAGPRSGRSGGYSGTLDDYSNLYKVACTGMGECIASCEQAGGTKSSCTEGSECTTGTDRHCLPPTYWRYEDEALVENDTSNGAGVAEQTLVKINYQDPLVLTDFGLQIPPNAKIRGIQFDVRKGALTADMAVDDSVRVLRGGQPVGTDHKQAGKNWPATLTYVSYGGPNDTWGESWTPADLATSGFGLSIAARYLDTAGNDRAYVDYARVTVFYTPGNCP